MPAPAVPAAGRPIGTQLSFLVVAAVVPLLLAFAYDLFQETQAGFDRARGDADRWARVAAVDAQGYFARTEQRLGDISRRVEVGSLDPGRCKSLFADTETIGREYAGLAMVDRDGRVVCLAGTQQEQAAAGLTAARLLLPQADGLPRLLLGNPVKDGASGLWMFPLAYPVRGGDGRAAGMVIAAAPLERFQSLVATLDLPEKPISMILKSEGTVLACSRDPDRHVGESRLNDPLTQAMLQQRSGVLRGRTSDGVERIYGFHPVSGTDWLAMVGLDVDPIQSRIVRSALRHGAYGLGVLALALALSYLLGRRISLPVAALARTARSFGEGRREARALAGGPREVSEVAVQLNSMLDILAERERSLLEAQAKLDAVLDSMELALWSFTPEMDATLFVSASTEKIFGRDAEDFRLQPRLWLEMAQPDDRPQAEAMLERVLQAGAGVIEYRIVRPEGNLLWVEIRWRHASDAQGRRIRLDGIACDITERKLAEEENRQLLALVEQSRNEIYVFDAVTLRYEYANAGALLNLGYSFRHLRLLTPLDLMPHYTEGALTRLIGQLLQHEKTQQVIETAHRRSDGSDYPVEVHLQAVEREGRWKCLVVAIDISERQRAQAEIIKLTSSLERRVAERTAALAEANAEMESFVYSVSHDLRTPLRAINGYASILVDEQKGRLDPESVDMLQRIARGAVRMGELIDDLLTFSRVGRSDLNRMRVDMKAMLRTVVEELHRVNSGATVAIRPLPDVEADPALLRQALLNLVGNALKFSSRRSDARVEIGFIQEGGLPVYYVKDNGAGFDPEHAGRLFGVFQRLHQEAEFPGTGVGLAIVKRIIERHKGRVWAVSSPGKGATFYFTLP